MRKADNLPPSYAVVTKSGSLNFLEPSGPVQACNGTALPAAAAIAAAAAAFIIPSAKSISWQRIQIRSLLDMPPSS